MTGINLFTKDFYTYKQDKNFREKLIASLLQDLKDLLNTKATSKNTYNDQIEDKILPYSILDYGICDLSKYVTYSKKDRDKILSIIKNTIEKFETRLSCVKVYHKKETELGSDIFNFYIRAKIKLKFEVLDLAFDSKIDNLTKTFHINFNH